MVKGSCLCGQIRFEVGETSRGFSICHCGQCRKQSGHVWASGVAQRDDIKIDGDVTWFASSEIAKRGFCAICGSSLFWSHNSEPSMSFALGALDAPTGVTLEKHIFVQDKGDYYVITDGLPELSQ